MVRPTAVLIGLLFSSTALADPGNPDVAVKSDSTVAPGDWSLQLALGQSQTDYDAGLKLGSSSSSQLAGLASLRYGLSDRLTWAIPTLAFAYRFGDRGGTEIIPYGGITTWGIGYSSIEGWIGQLGLGAGAALRWWADPDTAVNVTGSIGSTARWAQNDGEIDGFDASFGPTTWGAAATVGLTHHLTRRVALNVGARGAAVPIASGDVADTLEPTVEVGSVQSVGLRALPLVEVKLTDGVSIDGHASLGYGVADGTRTSRLLLGSTFTW